MDIGNLPTLCSGLGQTVPPFLQRRQILLVWMRVPKSCQSTAPKLQGVKALLSNKERKISEQFHFRKDHDLYVFAHLLKRLALAHVTGIPPARLTFSIKPKGKPYLSGHEGFGDLDFNLSHTNGLVCLAVARDLDVGIDAEICDRPIESLELARTFFAPADISALQTLPVDQRADAFYRIWTLKEAFIKATGEGLSRPLYSFFMQDVHANPIVFDATGRQLAGWMCHLYQPIPNGWIALASRNRERSGHSDASPSILCRSLDSTQCLDLGLANANRSVTPAMQKSLEL